MNHNVSTLAVNQWRQKLDHAQRSHELEKGRYEVLKMAASDENIVDTLQVLCEKANAYNEEMFCSVLRLNEEEGTLHPTAAYRLPEFYCEALEGVKIGQGVGSCGTAAFRKERVIVEDINTHPFWTQYKGLALSAGLQSCWSEPIIGHDGKCYGTFAMYYAEPKTPSNEDLSFIEASANLAAIVFENKQNREQLINANKELEKTLDTRSNELFLANQKLEQAIEEQRRSHLNKVAFEKMETTTSLVVGIAHELNTPIGVTVTSLSATQSIIQDIAKKIDQGTPLSRSALQNELNNAMELLGLGSSSLLEANSLLEKFKAINTKEYMCENSYFSLIEFFNELKSSLEHVLVNHTLELDIAPVEVSISKVGLSQVFTQLIENSIQHGFKQSSGGTITLHVNQVGHELHINYQDNGVGIADDIADKIFEPFYVSNREHKGLGLGLNMVTNVVRNMFHGDIKIQPAPVGARFEIIIPISSH